MHHAITTIPWGDDEGLPVLHLRGSIETPAEADALVAEVERRYADVRLGGTLVELGRYDTAAHAAALISLNSHPDLCPALLFGSPADAWPAAPARVHIDISEFFGGLPADLSAWAEKLIEVAQRCPRATELLVKTEVAPTHEMLGHAFSAFAVQSAHLHVPERIAVACTLAAARSGYAWKVKVRP